MKTSELTHMIRQIVAEEIRKELPSAIAEVFSNFMGQKQVVTERAAPRRVQQPQPQPEEEELSMKQSLRELFAGTNVMRPPQAQAGPRKLAKDPLLNEILNQTAPFSAQQRMGAPMGAAAMMAAAQGGFSMPGAAPMAPMMAESSEDEPAFTRGMPSMHVPSHTPHAPMIPPVSQAALLNDNHVPLEGLPEGVSVLDLVKQAGGDDPVTKALTKNYSGFLKKVNKAADQRKGVM